MNIRRAHPGSCWCSPPTAPTTLDPARRDRRDKLDLTIRDAYMKLLKMETATLIIGHRGARNLWPRNSPLASAT